MPCAVPLALADGFSDILEEALAKIIEADTDFGAQEVAMCQQVDAELSDGAELFFPSGSEEEEGEVDVGEDQPESVAAASEDDGKATFDEVLSALGVKDGGSSGYELLSSGTNIGSIVGPFFNRTFKATCSKHSKCFVMLRSNRDPPASELECLIDLIKWLKMPHDSSVTCSEHLRVRTFKQL